jgi:hypothetical protein
MSAVGRIGKRLFASSVMIAMPVTEEMKQRAREFARDLIFVKADSCF